MSSSALLRLEALRKCNTDPNWVNADLYRLLYKTDLYVVAYEKVKSAPGHIRKVGGKPVGGFAWLMRLQNRKQVPVCRECHRKIHRGEYDGLRRADLAYRVGP